MVAGKYSVPKLSQGGFRRGLEAKLDHARFKRGVKLVKERAERFRKLGIMAAIGLAIMLVYLI